MAEYTEKFNLFIYGDVISHRDLFLFAKSLYPEIENPCYVVKAEGKGFDDYKGEPIIIYSYFTADDLISMFGRESLLKGLSDRQLKYSSIPLTNPINIFNNCGDYIEFVKGLKYDEEDELRKILDNYQQ